MHAVVVIGGIWIVLAGSLLIRRHQVTKCRHVSENGTVHYGGGVMKRLID